ncbi:MAG: helical backbone metal receptor [Bacteroidota bacterium]|jgi:ABC-type Fe3+-hydroxamate transport system substrate-binding protein
MSFPKSIVSVVPSQTELLHYLGLGDAVTGITKFCIHPDEWFREKKRVGGTKTLHLDVIRSLKPDLILANREENERLQIEELAREFLVYVSDISDLTDALEMIRTVGGLTGTTGCAEKLVSELEAGFSALPAFPRLSAAYLIWREPYMAAGAGTFIHSMMDKAGFDNVFGALTRYPEVTPEMLAGAGPDVVLLSSEPYPFREKHLEELSAVCPRTRVILADGELFSWYGSRLLHTPDYFKQLRTQF